MKILLISFFFFLGTLATSVALAESITGRDLGPERLTELQMDDITAGAVAVSVVARAAALGIPNYTSTRTNTYAFSFGGGIVEIGIGAGRAYACCGPYTYAEVSTGYYSDADLTFARTVDVQRSTPRFSFAAGRVVVVGINLPDR